MQFGDEGKGSFVDYIASTHNIKQVVRYNGGSQASHTVTTPQGILHKFSQLGSAMFLDGCHTYISGNMVVNPFNLVEETRQFAEKTGQETQSVLQRVSIDDSCYIVTPYHKLVNQMREISEGDGRRGSVGTGVSEVRRILSERNIGIKMQDLFDRTLLPEKLGILYSCTKEFYDANKNTIDRETPASVRDSFMEEARFLLESGSAAYICKELQSLLSSNKFNITFDACARLQADNGIVFEGAQGLLIDEVYGFKPNTTILDTTIENALNICEALKAGNIVKIGVAKAFTSRHGMGAFPTETAELNGKIDDANQESSFWNGAMRFGWFDAVLMRYAQSVNNVDELFMSSIDKLDSFATIKICNSYRYSGEIDDEFNAAFEYERKGGCAFISNIIKNTMNISKYLHQCIPVYIELDGWERDTSQTKEASSLPQNCLSYIAEIERQTNIRISLLSVGATRNEKLVM